MSSEKLVSRARRILGGPIRALRKLTQPAPRTTPHPLVAPEGPFYCPVCNTGLSEFADFKPSESRPGRKALCPICWSLERTRAISLFLQQGGARYLSGRMLHFAPEPGLESWLRAVGGLTLITTDLMKENVDVQADITDLPFEDAEFDLIYCSNVLEHIPDDAAAMRQLFRVLRPGGLAIIQVPIRQGPTIEDLSITDPATRDRLYGQSDHVRWYGRDISERLESAGFRVREIRMPDHLELSAEELRRYGVDKSELIHFCERPD